MDGRQGPARRESAGLIYNNICTFDFCDTLIGVIHIQINVNDNNTCTIDGYDPITGVFHNTINSEDGNASTMDVIQLPTIFVHIATITNTQ